MILWDRLFGTFEAEREPVRYGLVHDIETFNTLRIAAHERQAIGPDLRSARGLGQALGYIFAAPGWSPTGVAQTASDLRRARDAQLKAKPTSD